MSTGQRKQREMRQREEQILEAAQQMLIAEGYHGLNMDRIAERLQYSKGTIYKHFPCKEEIIIALAIDTEQQRIKLFERAAGFHGRARERMAAIGVAAGLFASLHRDRFRVEQIVRSASIWEKTSENRRVSLQACEARCIGILAGIVRDAIAQGDLVLPPASAPEDLVFGLWALTYGAYSIILDNQSLANLGIHDPLRSVRDNQTLLLDGYGWRPVFAEFDYAHTYQRIEQEIFADEFRTATH